MSFQLLYFDMKGDGAGETAPSPLSFVDYGRLVATAEKWLVENLAIFNPLSAKGAVAIRAKTKAFDELCLYAVLAETIDGQPFLAPEIGEYISTMLSNKSFRRLAMQDPAQVLLYVFPAVYAKITRNSAAAGLADYVREVLNSSLYWSSERVPHRILDGLFSLWLLDRSNVKADLMSSAWAVCNGSYAPHPSWNSLHDYYAFTHNIFFYSKLGLTDDINLWDGDRSSDNRRISFGVLRFLAEDNLDICGELVLAQALLGIPHTAASSILVARVISNISNFGHVIGRRIARSHNPFRGGEYEAYCSYHPTLVNLILMRFLLGAKSRRFFQSHASTIRETLPLSSFLQVGQLLSALANKKFTKARMIYAAFSQRTKEAFDNELNSLLQELPAFVKRQRMSPDG